MAEFGEYTRYVLAAYAISSISILGLIAWGTWRMRSVTKKLGKLEARDGL